MAKKKTTRRPAAKKTARKTTAKKTVRKPAAKKTARKTTAKKKAPAKKAAKKAPAKKAAKKTTAIKGSTDPRTKSQIFNTIADATEMSRKEITTVLGALESMIVADLKKGTAVKLMGMKLTVKKKPATKARKGTNPFTGEQMMFKAKPASKAVKVRALKTLNDQV
ncbi:MAG: integration host factor [Phycisphaerae bacterium]|nr:integration host factor [Phycisphaerae bacterium]